MRVQVYKNLHLGRWSLRDPTTKLVVAHEARVELRAVTCCVQLGGRARVLADGRRRVHAYVVGELIATGSAVSRRDRWTRITYNPFRSPTFETANRYRHAVHAAPEMILDESGAWVQKHE